MFWRWTTALMVSGKPISVTQSLKAIFLSQDPGWPLIRSAMSGRMPCRDSWTWSTPARSSSISRSRVMPMPEVIRFTYSPASRAWPTICARSLARTGFPARDMDLQHAQIGRLPEHPAPVVGADLARRADQIDRVGAIGAGQRAAMRDLGQHRHGQAGGDGVAVQVARLVLLVLHAAVLQKDHAPFDQPGQEIAHVAADLVDRRVVTRGQVAHDPVQAAGTVQFGQDRLSDLVQLHGAFRGLQHADAAHAVALQPHAARQIGDVVGSDQRGHARIPCPGRQAPGGVRPST